MEKQFKHLSIFTMISLVALGCQTPKEDLKVSENSRTYQEVWSEFFNAVSYTHLTLPTNSRV